MLTRNVCTKKDVPHLGFLFTAEKTKRRVESIYV